MTTANPGRAAWTLRVALDIVRACRLRGCARCDDCRDAARIVAAADRRIADATAAQKARRLALTREEAW